MKNTALILCLACLLAACDSFLDVEPKGQTIPKSYNHYRGLLYDAQSMSKAMDRYPQTITDDAHFPDTYIEDGQPVAYPYSLNNITVNMQRLYRFEHGAVFNDGEDDNLWKLTYARIYTHNLVINHIMEVDDASDDEKRALMAEAKVARAFDYLSLVAAYAPAFDAATAATDWAVPLVTDEEIIEKPNGYIRNTVAEVYEFIRRDLVDAGPDLKVSVSNPFYPNRSVGLGFFARMHLMRREYPLALDYALQALQQHNAVLNLTQYIVHPNPDKSAGRIILASDPSKTFPEPQDNPENTYVRMLPRALGMNGEVYASRDLLDLYETDLPPGNEDMRRTLWFVDGSHPVIGLFPNESLWFPCVANNVGLNTVECMLTAAEGYARRNQGDDLTQAAKLYNDLRTNRIKNYTRPADATTFSGQADAMTKILDERRREFPFIGMYRFIDLKRLNKEAAYQKTVTHTSGANTYTLEPNDNRWIIPLPPIVKGFRPDLPDYQR